MKEIKNIKIRRVLSLILSVCLVIVTQMSSFNGYSALADDSDEVTEESGIDELIEAGDAVYDGEALDELVLPEEETEPEAEPESEDAAESPDPESETAADSKENTGEEKTEKETKEETSENKEKNEKNETSSDKSEKETKKKTDEKSAESTDKPKDESAAESTDKPEGTDMPKDFEELKDEQLVGVDGAVASGIDGTVEWYIDSDYVLYICPTDGAESGTFNTRMTQSAYVPWSGNMSKITKVVITGTIKFNGYARYLFYQAKNMTEIEGAENLDMSTVTDAFCMFGACGLASLDASSWDTSNITNMGYMFYDCEAMSDIDVSKWDTSSANNMAYMFAYCYSLKQLDISSFDASNVTSMKYMFYYCYQMTNLDLSGVKTKNVTDMSYMFANCYAVEELDVSGFDTSNVTNMQSMFYYCNKLKSVDLSGFNTSKVTNMASMFYGCYAVTELDVSGFDTSNVTDMLYMFVNCSALKKLDLSSFDTSKITNMSYMFFGCGALTDVDVTSLDTSNATSMGYMFAYCYALEELDVSGFDTSNVTDMSNMFYECEALTDIDATSFNTANVTNMSRMFSNCISLKKADVSGFDTSKVTDMSYMFECCKKLENLDVSGFDTSNVTNMSNMFYDCETLTDIDVSGFNTANVTDMSYMFTHCSVVKKLDVSGFDTSKVTNMSYMFFNCCVLEEADVSGFDTANVTDMYAMFYECEKLTSIDVSGFNTAKVTNMGYMFAYCYIVKELDVSGFDTSNVTNMQAMFFYCTEVPVLDVTGFKTSNVTDMSDMFGYCVSVGELDLSSFDTSNVTTMLEMFYYCVKLTRLDVTSFNTSKVTDMTAMFGYCIYLRDELDLSSFDTSNVTSVNKMFYMVMVRKLILGPKVDSNFTNCALWIDIGGVYLSNNGERPSDDNYIGTANDLYAYQSKSSNRVDGSGDPISNVYCLCDVVVYDPNGGVWPDGSTAAKRVYYLNDEKLSLIDEQPTKNGESFIGWDRVKDYTASLYDLKTSITVTCLEEGDPFLTLYADWEGKDKIVYDTTDSVNGVPFASVDVSGTNAPAVECKFTIRALDNAPEPTNSTAAVSFSGEGSQAIDFGTIKFMRTGLYHYEITQSSDNTGGWVNNNGTKVVDVTVSSNENGEAYISSVSGVRFYNWYMGSILTEALTEQDKADAVQKNHQQSTADEESLYKSAQWTDKSNGVGNIDIVYNNTYSDTSSTTALYIFTNCTAHDFTADLAKKNIKFLLRYYDTVVAVCSMKTVPLVESDVTYEKFIFKQSDGEEEIDKEIDLYLDTICFDANMHLSAVWQLPCFDTCLDVYKPDAVFFSYDGSRGFDDTDDILTREVFGMSKDEFDQSEYPEPVLKHYDKTVQKLAELLKKREFYIMIAEGDNQYSTVVDDYDTFATSSRRLKNMTYLAMMTVDPVTMSTEEGRNKMKEEIDNEDYGINIRNYAKQELVTYGTEIYSYSQEMEKVLTLKIGEKYSVTDTIDPRFSISGDITVTVPVRQSDGSYTVLKEGEDYTLTITDDESGGKTVTVNFLEWDGYPAKISVPITLKAITAGFSDGNDWFDDTNIGEVSASVSDIIYDGSTKETEEKDPIVSIKADSPKLYLSVLPVLPTAGGNGRGVFTACGAALVALWVLRPKKRYGRKK